MHQMCRACRYERCIVAGMNTAGVQPKRTSVEQRRAFCTKSGLKRNKRFAQLQPQTTEEAQQAADVIELSRTSSHEDLRTSQNSPLEEKVLPHLLIPDSNYISSQPTSYNSSPIPPFIRQETPDVSLYTAILGQIIDLC